MPKKKNELDWDHVGGENGFTPEEAQALWDAIDAKDTEDSEFCILCLLPYKRCICDVTYKGSESSKYVPVQSMVKSDKSESKSGYTAWTSTKCKHLMQEVALVDGYIYASAHRDTPWKDENRKTHEIPELGVYFAQSWIKQPSLQSSPGLKFPWKVKPEPNTWPWLYVNWPDYGVPGDVELLCQVVKWTLEQIKAGVVVETGCMGGHGRTGTFLACLLAAQKTDPGEAIRYIRDTYCSEAIESEKQVDIVAKVYELLTGDTKWRSVKSQRKSFHKERKLVEKPKWTGHTASTPREWGKWIPGHLDMGTGKYVAGHYSKDVLVDGVWKAPAKKEPTSEKVWNYSKKIWEERPIPKTLPVVVTGKPIEKGGEKK